MKIFVSWSGGRSKAVAELLNVWVKCVLQATQPWISSRDIDRGSLWFSVITEQLKDTSVGIVCLTAENKNKPWILFEAGALAKGLSTSRVCTFLIDLKSSDLEDPLAQFNHTTPTRESMWQLVQTLNDALGPGQLDERTLQEVFDTYWPKFEEKYQQVLASYPATERAEPRSEANLLTEILDTTRALQHRMATLDRRDRLERTSGADAPPIGPDAARRVLRSLLDSGMSDNAVISVLGQMGVPTNWVRVELAEIRRGQEAPTSALATANAP